MSDQPKPTAADIDDCYKDVDLGPTAEADLERAKMASGKDLPTGPGVWKRDGQRYWCCTEYPPYVVKIGELGKLSNCVYLVSQLPRGNWFPAVLQKAIDWKQRAETAEASVKELGVKVGNLTGELDWQKKQTARAEAELAEYQQNKERKE